MPFYEDNFGVMIIRSNAWKKAFKAEKEKWKTHCFKFGLGPWKLESVIQHKMRNFKFNG